MIINIGYDTKSIDKAIKQLEEYKKKFQAIISTFLEQSAQRIIELANEEIDGQNAKIGLGSGIIDEIKSGWYVQPVSNTKKGASITIRNRTEKATYIEFGVGQVGKNESHDKADELHYGYDINSHGDNGWYFYAHNGESNIDIGTNYRKGNWKVFTKGQPALMFAYKATMDFVDNKDFLPIIENLFKGL